MGICAGILFVLAIPLFVIYFLSTPEKRNKLQLRLGIITVVIAIVLLLLPPVR